MERIEMLMGEHTKQALDGAAVLAVVGTLVDLLPSIAALFTIIWTALRIYEWFEQRMEKSRARSKQSQ